MYNNEISMPGMDLANHGRMRSPLAQSINYGGLDEAFGANHPHLESVNKVTSSAADAYYHSQAKHMGEVAGKRQDLGGLAPPLPLKTIEGDFSRQINHAASSFNNTAGQVHAKPEVGIFKMKENDSNLTPSTG